MSATEYIGHHPYVGGIISAAHVGGATLLQVSNTHYTNSGYETIASNIYSVATSNGLL